MSEIRWCKLDDGSFGVSGNGFPPARGEVVVASSKDGRVTRVAIEKVKHSNGTHWRASILRENGYPLRLETP